MRRHVVATPVVDEAGLGIVALGGKTPGIGEGVGGKADAKGCVGIGLELRAGLGERDEVAVVVVGWDVRLVVQLDEDRCADFGAEPLAKGAELGERIAGELAHLIVAKVEETVCVFSQAAVQGVVGVMGVAGLDEAVKGIVGIGECAVGEEIAIGIVGKGCGAGRGELIEGVVRARRAVLASAVVVAVVGVGRGVVGR